MSMKKQLFTYLSLVKSVDLWSSVKSWFSKKCNQRINFFPATLIFGNWGPTVIKIYNELGRSEMRFDEFTKSYCILTALCNT